MGTKIWRGDSPAVAQVTAVTVTADDAATTFKVTINGKVVSVAGTGSGTAETAAALQAALAASTIAEFLEVTWTYPGTGAVVTGTAATAGMPFTLSTSVSGGTGTISNGTTTASAGPNDLSLAANWSGGLPVNGDDVVFDGSTVDALYGLSALSGVTPNSLTVSASYTGKIGLPAYNGRYYEYRPTYLQLAGVTTTCNVGYGSGNGSGRVKLDFGSTAAAVNVAGLAAPADASLNVQYALLLKGTNASNSLNVTRGTVGVAALPGETANLSGGLTVGYQSQQDGDSTVYLGAGVTLGAVTQSGGNLTVQSNATALTQLGGTCYQLAGAITNLVPGGTFYAQASGAFATTINVPGSGKLDLSRDLRPKSWTTCNLYKGATLNDPEGTSFAGGPCAFKTVECTLEDVTVVIGINHTYTPS